MILPALTFDKTEEAILAAIPLLPVPPSGHSPAIDALRSSREGHAMIYGAEGPMLVLRRAWLELDMALDTYYDVHLPYGSIGDCRLHLRCGYVPSELFFQILGHFVNALPNEAAAFVIWDEQTGDFFVHLPEILQANAHSLHYRPPVLPPHQHIIVDAHSHGAAKAFFSHIDDEDDRHTTKISMVLGNLTKDAMDYGNISQAYRISAGGGFFPIRINPFGLPIVRPKQDEFDAFSEGDDYD